MVAAPRPRAQQALEALALVLAGIALTALLGRVLRRVDGVPAALLLGLALLAGYLAADLASGLVHWFGDRFFEEDTRLIGRVFIVPFREHHRDPLAMTRHDSLELLGSSALGTLPILAIAWWQADAILTEGLSIALAGGGIAANQLHAWAHARTAPAAIRWLQRRWLVLPPAHHARHHRGGATSTYCTATGWMNHVTDRSRMFLRLERVLRVLGVPATRAP